MIGSIIVSVLGYGIALLFVAGAWDCAKDGHKLQAMGKKTEAVDMFRGAGVGFLCAFCFACLTLVITRGAV